MSGPLANYLTIYQAAEQLEVGYRTVERMIRDGRIAAFLHGGQNRISQQEIDEYFKRQEALGGKKRAAREKARRPANRNRRQSAEPETAAG